jgi:hypothetical protein
VPRATLDIRELWQEEEHCPQREADAAPGRHWGVLTLPALPSSKFFLNAFMNFQDEGERESVLQIFLIILEQKETRHVLGD